MAQIRRKADPQELRSLLEEFEQTVAPWCRENGYSLHQAFEVSREQDPEKLRVLNGLWSTEAGKSYLRSLFRMKGGHL